MKNISFKQYRAIDLVIMAVILFVVETLTAKAANNWFPEQLFMLSPAIAMICIVMMRWGGFAAIHAVVSGAALCLAMGANFQQFMVYCVGNCFSLVSLVLIRVLGKEKIRGNALISVAYTAAAFFGAQIGRWIVGLLFGGAADSLVVFVSTDSLSLLFAVVVVLLSRRIDGLFEDQKAYLIRTESERRREQSYDDFE